MRPRKYGSRRACQGGGALTGISCQCAVARANRVSDAASRACGARSARRSLAGILGAGLVDAVAGRRLAAAPGCSLLALGLYGAFAAASRRSAASCVSRPRWTARGRPAGGRCATSPAATAPSPTGILACLRRACVVVAVVAAAGQRMFVGKMQSQKLATIAAGGLVAIGALPGAVVALAALPLLRRIAGALPRPRALGATGVLLIALGGRRRARGRRGAVARRLAGARPRAALRARRSRSCSASGTACSGSGRRPGARCAGACRRRLGVGAVHSRRGRRVRLPGHRRAACPRARPASRPSPTDAGACARCWASRGARPIGDGDGFSARFGGGDCDDARGDVYPGARGRPRRRRRPELRGRRRQGVARAPAAAAARASADASRRSRRAPTRFKGNLLIITIDALRGDRLGVAGYGRPPGKSLTPTLDALARRGAYFRRVWSQAPNTPQVVPVDPDRALPVGHRLGQAGHELPQPAAHQPDLLRDAGRRGLEADRHLLALLLHAPTAASAAASPSGPTTAPARSPNRTRTSPRRASSPR